MLLAPPPYPGMGASMGTPISTFKYCSQEYCTLEYITAIMIDGLALGVLLCSLIKYSDTSVSGVFIVGGRDRFYTLSPEIWRCTESSCILHLLYDEGLLPVSDSSVIDEVEDTSNIRVERLISMPLGVALGDSLGSTLEFRPIGENSRLKIKSFPRGSHVTDDTQLTYWALEVLLRRGWLDPEVIAERYSRERIIGIGGTVREFLRRFKDEGLPWYYSSVRSAGNGGGDEAAAGTHIRVY